MAAKGGKNLEGATQITNRLVEGTRGLPMVDKLKAQKLGPNSCEISGDRAR